MNITVAIPTLGRDKVLTDTIKYLLNLEETATEILIIDQTSNHDFTTEARLTKWHQDNRIRWIRIHYKSITRAMNIALREAESERVLFLDDDIIPDQTLITAHKKAATNFPKSIIAGRVLQPWHNGKEDEEGGVFLFNSLISQRVKSFMAGNVSIPRDKAIEIGGFDTNFVRVAYHFEAEFSYRWVNSGNEIFYESTALIHHLKTKGGGTRSYGNHLTTIRPDHTVGRHYFNLCCHKRSTAIKSSIQDMKRCILTKHHLNNPHWIPFTLVSELLGFIWAVALYKSGRGTISSKKNKLLIISSHPIQYYSPLFIEINKQKRFDTLVLYLTLPDPKSQSLGFLHDFSWDIPLLDNYIYTVAKSNKGKGLRQGFFGIRLQRPIYELKRLFGNGKPDVVLITGWHFWGMVQMFFAVKVSNIPIILRMDSNALRKRIFFVHWIYKLFFSWVDLCLTVGTLNREFCLGLGMDPRNLISSPHIVNNEFFHERAAKSKQRYRELRNHWKIPEGSFCFLYAGKLQEKKRPFDLLKALKRASLISHRMIHLFIVGTGTLESSCKQYVEREELGVSFGGFLNQTEMPNAYAISDCIVLPSSEGETWGLVVNEAMACGIPAIVSDLVGCSKDLVIDGITGYKYKCGDVLALSELIVKLAENAEIAQSMGRNAQKLVSSEYNVEKVTNSINLAMAMLNG